MKKLLVALLTVLMVLGLVACGQKKQEETKTEETTEKKEETTTDKVATHAEYVAAPVGTKLTIQAYVQDSQSWWEGSQTLYLQDKDGGYFVYNLAVDEDTSKKLVPGTKVQITGTRADYAGEIELGEDDLGNKPQLDKIIEGDTWTATAEDVTSLIGKDELKNHMNKLVSFKGLTVEGAPMYNWDGSGKQGDDVYFSAVTSDGQKVSFLVESYLRGKDTDVYKAAEGLKAGDVIDIDAYLYWYEGANPHVINITVK